ncbi:MAG: TIGR03545 family protein [Bacteriovoracaceae bacterium]|nr:TIGR03545 family protein [Bacteriovoracaceae bacterium]
MTDKTINTEKKKEKKKGPIRFEAIIPVVVLSTITFLYFTFYFDHHMKKLIEYVGTQANGAEVNVDGVRTSFIRGSFDLDRLQVTDPERPTHNSIEIGNMHFQYLWDALLRMKFVVDDASINNIQLLKPRTSPGKVLPPEPAKPSKIDALQLEVMAQVKNKYGANMLGDVLAVLEGGDYEAQIQKIRGTLKSEARVNAMVSDVQTKKEFWDGKVKELSDTSKLKEIETTLQAVKAEKNFVKQAQGISKLNNLLNDVHKQYKEIETSTNKLQAEVKAVANYPKELQALVNEDITSLKNRFSVPQIDFKDMAMHLFAGEFAQYIAKGRKYQALAEQYLPEKKEPEDVVIPPKRSEGKNYDFPITTGYPLFWLKRAAISSKGTADSYSGQVSGELTNVTTSPKQINRPVVLDMRGDFPAAKVMGVKALLTADFTKAISKQSALIQVNSFAVPEKLFVNDEKLKFGFLNAIGTSTISATLQEQQVNMSWTSALNKPQFLVETSNKIAKEMLTNVVNSIPVITIDGKATGSYKNLNMDIKSNLGTELGQGFTREIGAKVTEAQDKINALVEEKIKNPKETLMAAINGNNKNLSQLGNLEDLYKKNEDKIKAEIAKLKNGGGVDKLKEQGKKIFKGIKF